MDIRKLTAAFLLLITVQSFGVVHSTLPNPKPPPDASVDPTEDHPERDNDSEINLRDERRSPLPPMNVATFPTLLDMRMLHNMPMVILNPSRPINLELLQNMNVKNKQNSRNSLIKLLGAITQGDIALSKSVPQANDFRDVGNRHNNKNHVTIPKEETDKDQKETRDNDAAFSESSSTVIEQSARGFADQAGWLEKFKGTFSNMFPHRNPFLPRPMPFGFSNPQHPSPGLPLRFPNNVHANMNPFLASNNNPVFVPFGAGPFGEIRIPQHQLIPLHPSQAVNVDLLQEASHQFPLILPPQSSGIRPGILFGGRRRLHFPHPVDQMTSASESLPQHVLPPKGFGGARFILPPYPGSLPLGKKDTPISATSAQINNAFADFAVSEKDPAVVEGFASVGGSINKFLNMMGLGVSGITQGFGDFSGLDASGRGITSRSLDFFPGYGNQAMLDDMDDMDMFQEDITEQYLRTQPKTTKATHKPSTKPPSTVPQKKQTTSKSILSTKPTAPPNSSSKAPVGIAEKQPMQIMHPKANGSMMGKMPHPEKMKMGDTRKAEQSKGPQKENPGTSHPDFRGMAEKSKMTMPSSMKNHEESEKMQLQLLRAQMAPKQNPPSSQSPSPQHDPRQSVHANHDQKNFPMGQVEIHGGGGRNVQNPNKNPHAIQPPDAPHGVKPPVHTDDKQRYAYTWNDNSHHDKNRNVPNIVFGEPMILFYSNGELKAVNKLPSGQITLHSQPSRPQDHPSEKPKTQANDQGNGQIPNSEKKPTLPPKASGEKSYASAHTMSDPESSSLLNTDDVRPWIPVSTGRGYVERRPANSKELTSPRKEQVKEIVQMFFKNQRENSETVKQN